MIDSINLYENQFDPAHNFPESEIHKTLIIASTPRSGSHFLGHALFQSKHFGFPLEYANPVNMKKWKDIYGETKFFETLGKIELDRTSENGVFAIKTHYSHLAEFGGINGLLQRYKNPHFILLTRSDIINQAVSLAIARQTGIWISDQLPKNSVPKYNYDEIHYCLKRTLLHNASWKYLLTTHNCKFIDLDFSDLKKDLKTTILKISNFIGVDVPEDSLISEPVTKQQSNNLNVEWINRFLKEHQRDKELIDIEFELDNSRKQRILKVLFGK
ncbi:Stf0 family sulfotransferase [Glaciecola sp. SC05]|uniref:Stf0 family sulfotransferase n=1 Tax=Glaciecola sp. SC05 TaxID=1987355 RepID=UPI0035291E2F